MSVIQQNWQNYSKLKYDLGKEYSALTESHAKEMSDLKATLAQGGLTTDDPTYSLRVNKLLTNQMEAQESVTAARDELSSGAIKNILTDPYYRESYGSYITGLAGTELRRQDTERQRSSGDSELSDYVSSRAFRGTASQATTYLSEAGVQHQGMEEFYGERYGEYTAPIEEIRAEKSAASLAQARGVSGGQMSKTKRQKPSGSSIVGGNKFLGAASSLSSNTQGWWS